MTIILESIIEKTRPYYSDYLYDSTYKGQCRWICTFTKEELLWAETQNWIISEYGRSLLEKVDGGDSTGAEWERNVAYTPDESTELLLKLSE